MKFALLTLSAITAANAEYFNEIKVMEGHAKKMHVVNPLPHT
jgi:hypothetical protein